MPNGATNVADIVIGGADSSGAAILTVYTKIVPRYAVYRTAERVAVQFADDAAAGDVQRAALAPLNPVRGQINGLIDGWRPSLDPGDHARALLFDRRVADALATALQDGPAGVAAATELLVQIKDDVVAERTSRARVVYGAGAAITAIVLILLSCLFTWSGYRNVFAFSTVWELLWLGVGAGALGALFSVGIGLQGRTDILTDLQKRENVSDAIVRIMIGSVSGLVLVALLQSRLVTITFGTSTIPGTGDQVWLVAAFVAFLAGFSERLVPSLLEQGAATAGGRAAGGGNPLAGPNAAPARPAVPPPPPPPAAPPPTNGEPPPDAEDETDGCVENHPLDDSAATRDVELPAADGGVESPARP